MPGNEAGSTGATPASGEIQRRIRDRYFKARFPSVPLPSEGVCDASAIIRSARLYFEDGEVARSVELLQMAAAMMPDEPRLTLAALEILFRRRAAANFVEVARQFHARFPAFAGWPDVARLGRHLVPGEALFAGATGTVMAAPPEPPNWIDAPLDFTSEITAAEFRREVLASSPLALGAP